MRRKVGLLLYAIGVALPIAFAILGKWYLGVWGFGFPLDPLGVFVILLMTGPFSALFFIIGFRLRRRTEVTNFKGT
ncbi:hypothetical protein [Sphingopyxis sp. JAI108]|uniref:hypothetical protein n=1 Tax=Sphingopyxis sp. JAI108 TaxID=2723060 RepID=UPI0015CD5A89|nr:hypothetical protein [Sphingopyxis sp. JAI108]NYF32230.1 hypothetical protein [Sphingopyxis sp. JAI108]